MKQAAAGLLPHSRPCQKPKPPAPHRYIISVNALIRLAFKSSAFNFSSHYIMKKQSPLISQGTLNRIFQEVNEAWIRCEFQPAIELLESARRRDPTNSGILLNLGRMYGLRHDYDAAKRCFEKAVSFSPRKTETLDMAGRLSVDFARQQMAEQYFQRASEQKDATPETFVRLAGLYERLRRTEEAGVMVNRALQLDGNCASARLTRARLNRQAGRLDEAERVLRPILVSAGRDIRIQCCYCLLYTSHARRQWAELVSALICSRPSQCTCAKTGNCGAAYRVWPVSPLASTSVPTEPKITWRKFMMARKLSQMRGIFNGKMRQITSRLRLTSAAPRGKFIAWDAVLLFRAEVDGKVFSLGRRGGRPYLGRDGFPPRPLPWWGWVPPRP